MIVEVVVNVNVEVDVDVVNVVKVYVGVVLQNERDEQGVDDNVEEDVSTEDDNVC